MDLRRGQSLKSSDFNLYKLPIVAGIDLSASQPDRLRKVRSAKFPIVSGSDLRLEHESK